ncbi:MAG: PEP-CTERM sorting domain-containing protein [Candidatus Eisenbacteria bacterium]|uniref:PEP-CTERM sorting domain-containing protein n=1 Tax=Eiseniibacteriota bacterium TaxID=2212470 RepID=A0A849SLS0_UNCEI|nr:PEP-CTERM sorting domain-containing protein [Candidatus Eisenbacteria bacterium]
MKKVTLAAIALVLMAAPAFAYVQPGSLNQNARLGNTQNGHRQGQEMDGGGSGYRRAPGSAVTPGTDPLVSPRGTDGENPTRPVPEPGTMAMASMGLLAIGAALRHKRGH